MFSKLKLRNGFQEIALVDFVGHYSKPWLHLTFFSSNIHSSVIVECLYV